MAHYMYILQSEKTGKYYVGATKNLEQRVIRHNNGSTPSTKSGRPWVIVYYEEYETNTQAITRERHIKAQKSRKYIDSLIFTNK